MERKECGFIHRVFLFSEDSKGIVVDLRPCRSTRTIGHTQLVRNRLYDRLCITPNCVICSFGKKGDCIASSVVYLITCQACGDQYIGETGRPLYIRVKEHLDGKTRSRISTPLGVHRRHSHGNCSFAVAVTILSWEPEIVARRTLEALWITARKLLNHTEHLRKGFNKCIVFISWLAHLFLFTTCQLPLCHL
ncbi:hypothetical protein Y032_0099g3160 [Ancylostoma ceylanicum]|uniref:GIY-YIG domain-containing protein n=1 Tax=Ancylostoma ceylanicum TaxID=53326 RepID=A0A016TIN4_9BILA|nr:hypothetical protein Y032_0099g3160 [Ancylostoma ceylanicum]